MKALLVGPTRLYKIICIYALFLLATYSWAQTGILTADDQAIVNNAKKIREQSKDMTIPNNVHSDIARTQAREFYNQIKGKQAEKLNLPNNKKASGRIIFFASFSLGDEGLDEILYAASNTHDSMVVFRGLKNEKEFARSVQDIQRMASNHSPIPNVIIDPTLFRDYSVSKVPTIVYLDEEKKSEVARVSGLVDAKWLSKKVSYGKGGDHGVRGPVEGISERDLIEVMQDKVANIDWASKKEEAINSFWEGQEVISLRRAAKSRVRYLDPSIRISNDIKDANGNVIIPRGVTINPLELKSFNQAVIVFDPVDPKQVNLVTQKIEQIRGAHQRITLIATQFDRLDGWGSYRKVTDQFNSAVYKLTPDLISRFEIEYVPTVITSENKHFVIEELAFNEETGL